MFLTPYSGYVEELLLHPQRAGNTISRTSSKRRKTEASVKKNCLSLSRSKAFTFLPANHYSIGQRSSCIS